MSRLQLEKVLDQDSMAQLPIEALRSRNNEAIQLVRLARVELMVTLAGVAQEANRPLFVLAEELRLTQNELAQLISVSGDVDEPLLMRFLGVCDARARTVKTVQHQLSILREVEWTQRVYSTERMRREKRAREAQVAARERETAAAKAAAEAQATWSNNVPVVPIIAVEDAPGHNSKPDPLKAKTEEEFVDAMRRYRVWAHNPSLRKMAQACGQRISHATFRNMLRASTVPKRFDMVEAFVMALNGTEDDMRIWASAWRHFTVPAPQIGSVEGSQDASVHHLTAHRKPSLPALDHDYTSSAVVHDAGRG